ncbi:MAG: hypothetical protein K6F88_03045 [Ruminococcus sp.]|nr:hypothetical protein [Ruminococcus sp.]
MKSKELYVNKEELSEAAVALDAAEYIIEEIQSEYFDRFDNNSEDDRFAIAVEFTRFRAKAAVLSMLINKISTAFETHEIKVYK